MARQENLFLPESFKRIVIQTLFRSHERDIVNINYSPMKNSSCLEIKVDLKMCEKLSFEIKVDFKVDLKSRSNFVSCLEIKVVFKMCQSSPFISTLRIVTTCIQKKSKNKA